MYKAILLEEAKADFEMILTYQLNFYQSTFEKFLNEFDEIIIRIKENPFIYQKYEYNDFYRRAIILGYLTIYHVDEDNKLVQIYRIIHGKNNTGKI